MLLSVTSHSGSTERAWFTRLRLIFEERALRVVVVVVVVAVVAAVVVASVGATRQRAADNSGMNRAGRRLPLHTLKLGGETWKPRRVTGYLGSAEHA